MNLKITNLTLLLLFALISEAFGQVVLQANKLPVPGDLWLNKTITDTTIQPGPAGPNQTWSFTNFFVDPSVISEQFATPNGTGNDALFPSANLKVNSFFGGDDYYLKTPTDLQYLGSKSSSNEIFITNMQKVLAAPFAYDDSIVNPNVTGSGFGQPLTGTIKIKADGWGSLSLFTGSFASTLRVFTDMNLVLAAGTGLDTYIQIQRYTWYSQNYKAPVFQISIIDINGAFGNTRQKVTTVSTLTTDLLENIKSDFSFSLSPNPASNITRLNIQTVKTSSINLQVIDMIGKVWKEVKLDLAAGENKIALDLSVLPKGVYIVSANSGNRNRKQRIILE